MRMVIWIDNEKWKPVVGYEGFYEVSNLGRIRSLDRSFIDRDGHERHYKGKIMALCDAGKGYRNVQLQAKGKRSTPRVCRVVATAWIPNPNNLPQVNHKDEDKTNDSADNLEWCTAIYNTRYGTGIERRAAQISKRVKQYDLNGNFIAEWPSATAAAKELGIDQPHIIRCCRGKLRKTGGYVWKYAD